MTLNYFGYFTEVEDYFLRQRGKTLLLSPVDWALIESWKEKGVPLHVVLRGIERTFDSYNRRPAGGRRRTIKTLLYCQEEIEAQYAEWLESQIGRAKETCASQDAANQQATMTANTAANPAANATTNVATNDATNSTASDSAATTSTDAWFAPGVVRSHLVRQREELLAMRRANGKVEMHLSPAFDEAIGRVLNRLDELISDWEFAAQPSAERLEDALTQLEKLLDENLRSCFTSAQLADEEQHAQAQLTAYKARIEKTTYEIMLAQLINKRLRERLRIPRLSLFYL